ncbi:efflux RND transporter periplasmic adaptor subunit [Chitinophaga tropicalis]|uniref:Efflux RND transporter periplasmic adaptor subunit n=1 Tax=Chitinophaga tropicalis TaxID=2683588 RepID=A0A7K1U397_9BACT|nr:efflux RND transporter periplasmic adaptor subunit [Chitinophaga tropicalis]MVT08821.1 efflux RND transporter periplasmic adaptor subunit [Chitinophaga tropicalis]
MITKPIGMLSAALMILVFPGCGNGNKELTLNEESVKVGTMRLRTRNSSEVLSYSGSIVADNNVGLNFPVSGQVAAVYVQEGQHVVAGQMLAEIEPTEYRNNLMLSEASFEQAKDNFNRLELLHKSASLPERDYITAKVAQAQAEINRNLALKHLNDTRLFAPFSGIISSKQIDKGATAGPGITAFSIIKTDQVYAEASVPEGDISKIGTGDSVEVKIPALGRSVSGKIAVINPQADNASKTFVVKVRLANADGKMLPGMISTIDMVTTGMVQILSVPIQSIIRDANDIPYVYVVDTANHAIRKRVRTGGLLSNEVILIDGVRENDNVVIEGQNKLRDGQLVTPIIP